MATEESAEASALTLGNGLRAGLQRDAPWLFEPALGVCVVGSVAIAEACRRAGLTGPRAADLDLAWGLDVDAGARLLEAKRVQIATTAANRARGTLALRVDGRRVEITSYRDDDPQAPLDERIRIDLSRRDMTIGALAWRLADDQVFDPCGGLDDWRNGVVRPVGDVEQRVREHPVRWLRYYRRAHERGFALDPSVRRLDLDPGILLGAPPEAIAAELRAGLIGCASPGRFLLELHEVRLLATVAPELAAQFDGRPAGAQRHHPEISQALHLVLALEWAAARAELHGDDRAAVLLATLCHDLGKGATPRRRWPAHHAHERSGLEWIQRLFERLPGLGDQRARRLCEEVCALHLIVRQLDDLRATTLAKLYDQHFRDRAFRADLLAWAVAADVAGRLGRDVEADPVRRRIERQIAWIRAHCESVDAERLRAQHQDDLPAFRSALHKAWAAALAGGTGQIA